MQGTLPEGADVTNVVAADELSRRFRALLAASIDVRFTVKLAVGTDGVTTADGTFAHLINALNSAVWRPLFRSAKAACWARRECRRTRPTEQLSLYEPAT